MRWNTHPNGFALLSLAPAIVQGHGRKRRAPTATTLLNRPVAMHEETMERQVRKFLRFPPDDDAVAWIDPEVHPDPREFKPTFAALVTDEALVGCGLITLRREWMAEGAEFVVQIEKLSPIKAQIRWLKEMDDGVVKLGVALLD
jgi:hypothetical protein